jgi:glycogen operon protein
MFCAGDEFLETRHGNNNPYNQDNDINYLDWALLEKNRDIFRFLQGMIAFRKSHPSIARSQFWREDVSWYGAAERDTDFSPAGQSLAYCLRGSSLEDDDIYVMVNAAAHDIVFEIHEGPDSDWVLVADTGAVSPDDFVLPEERKPIGASTYAVGGRCVAVLLRAKQ